MAKISPCMCVWKGKKSTLCKVCLCLRPVLTEIAQYRRNKNTYDNPASLLCDEWSASEGKQLHYLHIFFTNVVRCFSPFVSGLWTAASSFSNFLVAGRTHGTPSIRHSLVTLLHHVGFAHLGKSHSYPLAWTNGWHACNYIQSWQMCAH